VMATRQVIILVFLFTLSIVIKSSLASCDIYVSPNGSRNNNGSMASPVGSIDQALDKTNRCSHTSCTICVTGGTYKVTKPTKYTLWSSASNGPLTIQYLDWSGSGLPALNVAYFKFTYSDTSIKIHGFSDIEFDAINFNNDTSCTLDLTISNCTVTGTESHVNIQRFTHFTVTLNVIDCTIEKTLLMYSDVPIKLATITIQKSTFSNAGQIFIAKDIIVKNCTFDAHKSNPFIDADSSIQFSNNNLFGCIEEKQPTGCVQLVAGGPGIKFTSITVDSNSFYGNHTFAHILLVAFRSKSSMSISNNYFDCTSKSLTSLNNVVEYSISTENVTIENNTFACELQCPSTKYFYNNLTCHVCLPFEHQNPLNKSMCGDCKLGQIWTASGCLTCDGRNYANELDVTTCEICPMLSKVSKSMNAVGNTNCSSYLIYIIPGIMVLLLVVIVALLIINCIRKRRQKQEMTYDIVN